MDEPSEKNHGTERLRNEVGYLALCSKQVPFYRVQTVRAAVGSVPRARLRTGYQPLVLRLDLRLNLNEPFGVACTEGVDGLAESAPETG